jgi:hypothetical protein
MDPLRYLRTTDSLERAVMEAVASKAQDIMNQRDKQLARMIRQEIGEMLGGR